MKIYWNTNEIIPIPDNYNQKNSNDLLYNNIAWNEIIVYSEKYNFFGELFFQESYMMPFEREIYPPFARNDNGDFAIEWKYVSKWIYKRNLKNTINT